MFRFHATKFALPELDNAIVIVVVQDLFVLTYVDNIHGKLQNVVSDSLPSSCSIDFLPSNCSISLFVAFLLFTICRNYMVFLRKQKLHVGEVSSANTQSGVQQCKTENKTSNLEPN
jgi:hypothetical protein